MSKENPGIAWVGVHSRQQVQRTKVSRMKTTVPVADSTRSSESVWQGGEAIERATVFYLEPL